MNPANWAMRYRIKRPFSRKIRVAPKMLLDGTAPPAFRDFAADPMLDPLAGALDFLLATYAGDGARARQVLDRLRAGDKARSLSQLFAENEIRKLVVACFRQALGAGAIDRDKATLLLDFARSFDPAFTAISHRLPEPAAVPGVLKFDYVERLSPKLRIVLMFQGRTASRPHDLGERVASALVEAGATCTVLPSETDPAEIGPADLVLIDEGTVFRKDPAKREAHLDKLRKASRRLGQLVVDPWGKVFLDQLARGAGRYDFLWGMAPTLHETVGVPREKFCLIPFPTGFARAFDEAAATAPRGNLGFCGTIEDYNLHRYFWLLAALARGAGLGISLTSQEPDGLGYEASLKIYLARLLAAPACLSLTMRPTGERILVGRTFDVLRGQRLLVQEFTPDARYYLTPGEDFVEIGDAEELPAAIERIRSGACEPIRAQGAETYRRAYSDLAVARHLATWI